jgi:methylase of polypeptide subunit release factors
VVNADAALLQLLRLLKDRAYRFIAVTPATHARVLARPCEQPDVRDIFGWNRPFFAHELDPELLQCLHDSEMVEADGKKLRSMVRVASLGEDLFLHSAFPTTAADAVFFGPDTYRFLRFVRERLPLLKPAPTSVMDMGAGSGAGAIGVAHVLPGARVTAIDINPAALRLAAINAEAAGVRIETLLSSEIADGADLIIANPPYIMDARKRAYRDGGELLGGQVALDWARQALRTLRPGGAMLLYTGGSVADGRAPLIGALEDACAANAAEIEIEEIDPDVFGEDLDQAAYASVERIAVIGATIRKR